MIEKSLKMFAIILVSLCLSPMILGCASENVDEALVKKTLHNLLHIDDDNTIYDLVSERVADNLKSQFDSEIANVYNPKFNGREINIFKLSVPEITVRYLDEVLKDGNVQKVFKYKKQIPIFILHLKKLAELISKLVGKDRVVAKVGLSPFDFLPDEKHPC